MIRPVGSRSKRGSMSRNSVIVFSFRHCQYTAALRQEPARPPRCRECGRRRPIGSDQIGMKREAKRVGSRFRNESCQRAKVWDARPWTPELRVEQEALSLVRFYSTPPISQDELLARMRADATISEPVRERALEFARQWVEAK